MEPSRNSHALVLRWIGIATVALVLTAHPAFATTPPADEETRTAQAAPGSETVQPSPATGTVLVTESAARVGVEPVRVDAKLPAPAPQITDDPTMRWLLIIGISAIAIWLIVTLAD